MHLLDSASKPATDFETALNWLATADREDMVYRGHGDAAWSLCPSLFRGDKGVPLDKSTRRWKLNRLSICLSDFVAEYNRIFPQRQSASALAYQNKVALAQHHGIPTPLMDWTDSSLVALFMACAFWDAKSPIIRVYAIQKSDFSQEAHAVLFDSLRTDPRQESQHGYLSYCIAGDAESSTTLSPHYMDEIVDGERFFREEIRYVDVGLDETEHARVMRFLDRNRISFQTLFPDSLQWSVRQLVRKHFAGR